MLLKNARIREIKIFKISQVFNIKDDFKFQKIRMVMDRKAKHPEANVSKFKQLWSNFNLYFSNVVAHNN